MRWFSQPGMDTHRSRGIEISETWPSLGRRMAITMVSVRKEPPGRRSEPISKKLTVSCPLLRTWLPEAAIVEKGTTVLIRMFGSIVGTGVSVGTGRVTVGLSVSTTGGNVPVGVQPSGWKGVGVGEALGAAVTKINGRAGCVGAGASAPHPARSSPARKMRWIIFLIRYCDGGGVGGVPVAVGRSVAAGGSVAVSLGVTITVAGSAVSVGKLGTTVTPGT